MEVYKSIFNIMYEVDHPGYLNDMPSNISNLIRELEEFKDYFTIQIKECKNYYKIGLQESRFNSNLNILRYIILKISENPCSYSILLFKKLSQNSRKAKLKKIYEIEVEGENDYKLIKKDVKDLISGKKGSSFSPTYPL